MTFIRFARLRLLAAAALLLTSCNTTKFDAEAASHIEMIALAGPAEPPFYIVTIYDANIAQPAGAPPYTVSGLIQEAADSEIDALFTEALVTREKLRLGADLNAAFAAALRESGYDVRTGEGGGLPAHAWLTVEFLYAGYVDQLLAPYEPLVWVMVTLTDARSRKELFRQRYNYSTHTGNLDDVRFEPDSKYDFRSDEELLADTPRAAEGLRAALPLIANDIAAKLKRQP